MARLCERPGCSDVAALAFGFDVDRLLVWLAPVDPDGDPLRAGALCLRHGDAMVVPKGWTLDDRREPTPRLFRPRAADRRDRSTRRRRAPRRPRSPARAARAARPSPTWRVPSATDDPDATVGHPVAADGRRSTTTSTACSTPTARCWPGPSAAPIDRAEPRRADVRLPRHRRRHARPGCSSTSSRSTGTRRGCASSTGWSRWRPTTAGRRGASSCAPGSDRSPARSGCGWCARPTSRAALARFERVEDDGREPRGVDPHGDGRRGRRRRAR